MKPTGTARDKFQEARKRQLDRMKLEKELKKTG